jgi:heat shock protein HslJ
MKRFSKRWLIPLLMMGVLLLATVSACGGSSEGLTLEGTKWIMTTYAVIGGMNDALTTPPVDATFSAPQNGNGQVSGSGGINQYSGPYTVDGSKLTVGTISSTRIAGEPAAMQQETAYLLALQLAASYEIENDNLTIKNASGVTVLTFKAGS